MKWRKVTGRKSVVHGTSSPRLPEDSPLDGLNEFPVTKAVDNRVDEWRQYGVDYSKCLVKAQ